MNKANNHSYLLTESDPKLIAECFHCSERTIRYVVAGDRGKRQTPFQTALKKILAFRTRQNENLKKLCAELQISEVTPKASN